MTFAADTSNCYRVRALYKIKIGLVRPQIYLIFFTALRLCRSGRKITIINSLGPLRQSSPLSHSTSAGAIEGLTKVTTVHARILSNRVCFLRFFGVFSAAKGYTFTNFLDRLPRTYVLLSRAGETEIGLHTDQCLSSLQIHGSFLTLGSFLYYDITSWNFGTLLLAFNI